MLRILLLLSALLAAGCEAKASVATAFPAMPTVLSSEPANEQRVRRFMTAYGAKRHASTPSYRYGLVDLNGDGVNEAIAWLDDRDWCGSGGCMMLVLVLKGDEYVQVSGTTITRPPIQALPTSTNGWRDLSVFVAGGGMDPHDAILRFDGGRYPLNPSIPPAERAPVRPTGEVVIPLLN